MLPPGRRQRWGQMDETGPLDAARRLVPREPRTARQGVARREAPWPAPAPVAGTGRGTEA
jgi:hypothetical protein